MIKESCIWHTSLLFSRTVKPTGKARFMNICLGLVATAETEKMFQFVLSEWILEALEAIEALGALEALEALKEA